MYVCLRGVVFYIVEVSEPYERLWCTTMVYDCLSGMALDGVWQYMAVYGGVWWCMAVYGGL